MFLITLFPIHTSISLSLPPLSLLPFCLSPLSLLIPSFPSSSPPPPPPPPPLYQRFIDPKHHSPACTTYQEPRSAFSQGRLGHGKAPFGQTSLRFRRNRKDREIPGIYHIAMVLLIIVRMSLYFTVIAIGVYVLRSYIILYTHTCIWCWCPAGPGMYNNNHMTSLVADLSRRSQSVSRYVVACT